MQISFFDNAFSRSFFSDRCSIAFWCMPGSFEVSDALATGSYPEKLLREAGWPQASGNVLAVGHQPTLGEVAALLLRGEGGDVSIRKGAIWWFVAREREGKMETTLKTVLEPDQAED